MSTETLKRTSVITEEYPHRISDKKNKPANKVNIDVLRKRVFAEQKRERFQNRVLVAMFFLSIAILGYIVV
tara:strand:- start:138 stop:350 length:213 start_codon:yes stop_codon:yes gene_type:complete